MKNIPLEILGILHDHSGYAVHTRALVRYLIKQGFSPKLIPYNYNRPLPFPDLLPYQKTKFERNYPIIRLVILPPHPVYQKNRYTILYTMMETASLHPGVLTRLKTADEVWTPNIYNVAQFRAGLPKNIPDHLMPEGTDTAIYHPNYVPMDIRKNADFVAVSVFNWQWRKGPDILLKAWFKAFTSKNNARLILRTSVPLVSKTESRAIIQKDIQRALLSSNNPNPAPIEVCDSFLNEKDMPRFYKAADCFVLPTRGEGWCLPAIDAMACGLPIIITRSTGQLAYCNNSNSVLTNPK